MNQSTRIVLARHGVTDFTATGRWDGRGGADPSLNAVGRAQAAALAGRAATLLAGAEDVRVISSTLNRARETAAPVAEAFGVAAPPEAAWDELAFGAWDGQTGDELRASHPDDIVRFWFDETFRVPGGESHIDLHTRVRPAFEALLGTPGTTIVVTHWGPIMSVLALVLGIDLGPARRLALAPTSMTMISVGAHGPQVDFVNDLGSQAPIR